MMLQKGTHVQALRHAQLTCGVLAVLLFLLLVGFAPALLTFEIAVVQYWANYQLSDAVRRMWEDGDKSITQAREKYAKPYPGSLADQYLRQVHKVPTGAQRRAATFYQDRAFDVALLQRLVARLVHPSDTTLVVHLRLGDALLNSLDPIGALWEGHNPHHMVLPRAFYECVARALSNATLTDVVIVASMMHVNSAQLWNGAYMEKRGDEYKTLVDAWFAYRMPFLKREWRSGHFSPDHDFAYMSTARHFVPGGGGFSAAAATLVRRSGGHVYDCASN
jgi:hypothetical protein